MSKVATIATMLAIGIVLGAVGAIATVEYLQANAVREAKKGLVLVASRATQSPVNLDRTIAVCSAIAQDTSEPTSLVLLGDLLSKFNAAAVADQAYARALVSLKRDSDAGSQTAARDSDVVEGKRKALAEINAAAAPTRER